MPYGPILIVDDEPQNLAALRQVLSEKYARLVFARNGKQALEVVEKHRPAMILLDVQMPDMNGYDVCRALKADPQTEAIPVIFVTSNKEVEDEADGFNAGAVDYITKPIRPAIVLARVETHLSLVRAAKLERSYLDAIYMLGTAGHYNDTDTGVHIWRIAAYCRVMATALGWAEEDCAMLEMAAPMHDTGKIGIPDSILRKPGKLDVEEWEIMKTHTHIGYEILSRSEAPIFQMAAEIALYHHEKWDGSGYPYGLSGESIPISARIVALTDVFDALTMKRPYKEPWPLAKVMTTLREGSGQHFDPELVGLFEDNLAKILEIKAEWETHENQLKKT